MRTLADARPPEVDQLVTSAQRHMRDALNAWKSNEHSNVASYAPTAIEHLGKAALWTINPVLLAPLETNKEKAFITLVTNPNLDTVYTIGLELVLQRLEAVVPNLRPRTPRPGPTRPRPVHDLQGHPHPRRLPLPRVRTGTPRRRRTAARQPARRSVRSRQRRPSRRPRPVPPVRRTRRVLLPAVARVTCSPGSIPSPKVSPGLNGPIVRQCPKNRNRSGGGDLFGRRPQWL